MQQLEENWFAREGADVCSRLGCQPGIGLTDGEAGTRLEHYGPNRLTGKRGHSPWMRFALQFHQPLIYILLASAVISALLREWTDAGVILAVVVINAAVGFFQEGKAEAALEALARTVASQVTVVRSGRQQRCDAEVLVPGDLVLLGAGDRVPADLRLLEASALQAAEAALTGESAAVSKQVRALPADTQLADRANMAFAGTMVVAGQGSGVVVATGDATETGRISRLLGEVEALSTPLTRAMARFSSLLLVLILGLAALTFVVGLLRGAPLVEMFMAAVALAVAAIPEGLPAAVTVTLAIGVARMARRRAIIRRLPAVETLGSTTVICSDKTGTLTENQMTVREILAGGRLHQVAGTGYRPEGSISFEGVPAEVAGALRETLLAGMLCNDAALQHKGGQWEILGDPTEAALLVSGRKAGLDEAALHTLMPRREVLPFDAAWQYMATAHDFEGQRLVFLKGSVERVLERCSRMLDAAGQAVSCEPGEILRAADEMAARGLRVLAFAARRGQQGALDHTSLGGELLFLGLQGMIDPPRNRALGAIRACHGAGIEVKMITGDHAATALAIARQLHIAGDDAVALSGRELAALDDTRLAARVGDVAVFARVAPEQKLRLVRALQARGEVVAMTGDGVNDAPALKAADIGIAMGEAGTEVAKEAAAMVLTDDNFATIEAAVEEGRGVYDNLVKFIVWSLPTNFGQAMVILVAVLAGLVLPITPLQILWVNLTSAGLLGVALSFEPIERGVMRRQPRPPGQSILDFRLVWRVVFVGLLMVAGAFALFLRWHALVGDDALARTVAVNTIIAVEIFYLFNCRSLHGAVWSVGWFSNAWIWLGIALMLGAQLAFTYVPALQALFGTAAMPWQAWGEVTLAGALGGLVVGGEKWLRAHFAARHRRD